MKRPLWQYLVAGAVSLLSGFAIYRMAKQLGEATLGPLGEEAGDDGAEA